MLVALTTALTIVMVWLGVHGWFGGTGTGDRDGGGGDEGHRPVMPG